MTTNDQDHTEALRDLIAQAQRVAEQATDGRLGAEDRARVSSGLTILGLGLLAAGFLANAKPQAVDEDRDVLAALLDLLGWADTFGKRPDMHQPTDRLRAHVRAYRESMGRTWETFNGPIRRAAQGAARVLMRLGMESLDGYFTDQLRLAFDHATEHTHRQLSKGRSPSGPGSGGLGEESPRLGFISYGTRPGTMPPDNRLERARRTIRSAYHDDVCEAAAQARQSLRDGNTAQALDRACEGHSRTFKTGEAIEALWATDKDGRAVEALLGMEPPTKPADFYDMLCRAAAGAFRGDVAEQAFKGS